MASPERLKELKESFKVLDTDHDGKLYFKEFFTLLKKGNPDFLERQAELLFRAADEDLSGTVDFAEFVDFLFQSKEMARVVSNIPDVEEEAAKQQLLEKSHMVRVAASSAAKAEGKNWRDLSWSERLEEVNKLEEEQGILSSEPAVKPPPQAADVKKEEEKPKLAEKRPELPAPSPAPPPPPPPAPVVAAPAPAPARPTSRQGGNRAPTIAEMSQQQIVDYSIQSDDLSFAGNNGTAMNEMLQFRDFLRTAPGPEDVVEIQKYIAKGTAGWVFQAEKKGSGGRRVALKLIRMTQARTGMKEWYVSKLLRAKGATNVVFTDETVRVIAKEGANPIVAKELANAGPVPYYICTMQEFLDGGSLEKLANEGKLSLATTLRALEEVSHALAMMHANEIQHRDVKPENVLLEMRGEEMVQAKVCDFGCAEIGNNPAGMKDDIRRFGVTFFSVITGEWWTKNRLIHENHENLVQRMKQAVEGNSSAVASRFPDVLSKILSGSVKMDAVAAMMTELRQAA